MIDVDEGIEQFTNYWIDSAHVPKDAFKLGLKALLRQQAEEISVVCARHLKGAHDGGHVFPLQRDLKEIFKKYGVEND